MSQKTTLGYPSMAVRFVGGGLPVTEDWFEMSYHLSPSLISIRLTAWTWIAVHSVPASRGRRWVTTNKQTNQVISVVKDSKFGFLIQLHEPTSITNNAQVLVYVRYTTRDNDVKTELLMSKELSSTSTGKDVFEVLDNFFKKNELDWKKLIGCTTNGAPSMLGRKSGFTIYVKTVSSNTTIVHCFMHRFALCAKVLPEKMLLCLKRVIKLVNFVKTSAVNTRLFKQLCEDFGSKHTCFLSIRKCAGSPEVMRQGVSLNCGINYFNFSRKRITIFRKILRVKTLLQYWPNYPTFLKF